MEDSESGKKKVLDFRGIKEQKKERNIEEWECCEEYQLNEEECLLRMQLDGIDSQLEALWVAIALMGQSVVGYCDTNEKVAWQSFQKSLEAVMEKFREFEEMIDL